MSEPFRCSLKLPLGLEENGHDFNFVVIFPRRAENVAGLLPLTTILQPACLSGCSIRLLFKLLNSGDTFAFQGSFSKAFFVSEGSVPQLLPRVLLELVGPHVFLAFNPRPLFLSAVSLFF